MSLVRDFPAEQRRNEDGRGRAGDRTRERTRERERVQTAPFDADGGDQTLQRSLAGE